jgi:hypothetical protein
MERQFGYKGHPSKQRNPAAQNIHKPRPPTNDAQLPAAQPEVQAPARVLPPSKPPKGRMSANPPPPRQSIVEKESTADTFFSFNMNVRERNIKVTQQPSLATYSRLVDLTFNQISVDDTNLTKLWTKEMFQYYCIAMLWLRIVHLKDKQLDDLNPLERQIIEKSLNFTFNIPEPIRLYINGLGEVQTKAGQHIYPAFPPLPATTVDNTPGYFGQRITANNHNTYEEIPCLGTIITLLKASLSPIRPFNQPHIPVVPDGCTPTLNLCFWHLVAPPRAEATLAMQSLGINDVAFPCSPANTGFNFQLLRIVSDILADNDTFKIHPVNFASLQQQGYLSQTIVTTPTDDNDNTMIMTTANVQPTSLNQENTGTFGMAVAFGYQLIKEPFEEDDHSSWSCLRFDDDIVPHAWILNRNERRTIPAQYRLPIFNGMSNNMADYLSKAIQMMVKAKR